MREKDTGLPTSNGGRFAAKLQSEPEARLTAMTPRRAFLVASAPEDDVAYRALADLAAILAEHEDARVVGGHMVSLITAAFPTTGLIPRRTGDADAGLPLELAGSGVLHDALLNAGYEPDGSGNRYINRTSAPQATIDLLIPSYDGRFKAQLRGGRGFDAAPGIALAVYSRPLLVETTVTFRNGSDESFTARVPGLETAVVLKALAFKSRGLRTGKDLIDLHNLLTVLDQHGPGDTGGWTLNQEGLRGSRGDATLALRTIQQEAARGRYERFHVPGLQLAALIDEHLTAV